MSGNFGKKIEISFVLDEAALDPSENPWSDKLLTTFKSALNASKLSQSPKEVLKIIGPADSLLEQAPTEYRKSSLCDFLKRLAFHTTPVRIFCPERKETLYRLNLVEASLATGNVHFFFLLFDSYLRDTPIPDSIIENGVNLFLKNYFTELEAPEEKRSLLQTYCVFFQRAKELNPEYLLFYKIVSAISYFFFSHPESLTNQQMIGIVFKNIPSVRHLVFSMQYDGASEWFFPGRPTLHNVTWLTGAILRNQPDFIRFLMRQYDPETDDGDEENTLSYFYRTTPVIYANEQDSILEASPLLLAAMAQPDVCPTLIDLGFQLDAEHEFPKLEGHIHMAFNSDFLFELEGRFSISAPTHEGPVETELSLSRIKSLQEEYSRLGSDQKSLNDQATTAFTQVKTLERDIAHLKQQIADKKSSLEKFKKDTLEKELSLKAEIQRIFGETSAELARKDIEKAELQDNIIRLKKEVSSLTEKHSSFKNELSQLRQKQNELDADLKAEKSALETQLKNLQAQIEAHTKKILASEKLGQRTASSNSTKKKNKPHIQLEIKRKQIEADRQKLDDLRIYKLALEEEIDNAKRDLDALLNPPRLKILTETMLLPASALEISPEYWEFYKKIRLRIIEALRKTYGELSDTTYLIALKGSRANPRPCPSKKNRTIPKDCTVHSSTDLDAALLYKNLEATPPVFLIQEYFEQLHDQTITVSTSRDSQLVSFTQKEPALRVDMWFYKHSFDDSTSAGMHSLEEAIPSRIGEALIPTLSQFFIPPDELEFDRPGRLIRIQNNEETLTFNCSRLLTIMPSFTSEQIQICAKGIAYMLWVKLKNEYYKPSRNILKTDKEVYDKFFNSLRDKNYPQITLGALLFIQIYYKRDPKHVHQYLHENRIIYLLFNTDSRSARVPAKLSEPCPDHASLYFQQYWLTPFRSAGLAEEALNPLKTLMREANLDESFLNLPRAALADSAICAST